MEIFIKLAILYTVILLCQQIVHGGLFNERIIGGGRGVIRELFLMVALIIGLFQFAKDAPKFISDALGIDSSSGGGMMGKMAKGLGGAAAGYVGGALHGMQWVEP